MLFNPHAKIELRQIGTDRSVMILDEALLEPQLLLDYAVQERAAIRPVDFNAYPGLYLPPPAAIATELQQLFNDRVKRQFGARRCLRMHCRLSMTTTAPEQLAPYQCLPHRDSHLLNAEQCIQASVLYLFRDKRLGGTSFYEMRRSPEEISALFDDATRLSPADFSARYGLAPGYLCGSNAYFECVATIPARWNRLIFYDGSQLHSGDIAFPELLNSDPARGRLTLNGFFTSRRNLA